MTLENLFSQVGLGAKQLTDRYAEYTASSPDQHVYYTYEPSSPSHTHVATSKHHGGGHKSGASMSALTLLAFLFFLHILQQCIKDHMTEMTTPPVVIMSASREGDDGKLKSEVTNKIDKTGIARLDAKDNTKGVKYDSFIKHSNNFEVDAKNPYEAASENQFIKINAAENIPKTGDRNVFKNYVNRSTAFPGFISEMDGE